MHFDRDDMCNSKQTRRRYYNLETPVIVLITVREAVVFVQLVAYIAPEEYIRPNNRLRLQTALGIARSDMSSLTCVRSRR